MGGCCMLCYRHTAIYISYWVRNNHVSLISIDGWLYEKKFYGYFQQKYNFSPSIVYTNILHTQYNSTPHKTHTRAIYKQGDKNYRIQNLSFKKSFTIDKVYTEIFGYPRYPSYI
jgi:hypothetical protein